jgi:nucleoside phosphorylase
VAGQFPKRFHAQTAAPPSASLVRGVVKAARGLVEAERAPVRLFPVGVVVVGVVVVSSSIAVAQACKWVGGARALSSGSASGLKPGPRLGRRRGCGVAFSGRESGQNQRQRSDARSGFEGEL